MKEYIVEYSNDDCVIMEIFNTKLKTDNFIKKLPKKLEYFCVCFITYNKSFGIKNINFLTDNYLDYEKHIYKLNDKI